MAVYLLDANVVIAAAMPGHEHNRVVADWLAKTAHIATCPIVEGALVRFLLRIGESRATVAAVLSGIASRAGHEFWPDSISYADVGLEGVTGHQQVTDAYLTALAAAHPGGKLATLDKALAARFPDSVELLG